MVTSWDLYDSFNVSEIEPASKGEATNGKSSTSHTTKKHDQTASVTSARGNIFLGGLHFCSVFILLNHAYRSVAWYKLHEENARSACLALEGEMAKDPQTDLHQDLFYTIPL